MTKQKKLKKKGPSKGTKYKDTNPYEFGKILARQRRKKGLSQAELGELIGVSKRAISHYERELSNPSVELIKKLCGALKISAKIFIDPVETVDKEDHKISPKLTKKLELLKTLSPKAQKSLQDYIDILVKAEGK